MYLNRAETPLSASTHDVSLRTKLHVCKWVAPQSRASQRYEPPGAASIKIWQERVDDLKKGFQRNWPEKEACGLLTLATKKATLWLPRSNFEEDIKDKADAPTKGQTYMPVLEQGQMCISRNKELQAHLPTLKLHQIF